MSATPTLKDWKRRYYGDATPERDDPVQQIRALKAELARLREQRDILKKRWAFSPKRRSTLPTDRSHESGTFARATLRRL